MSETIWDRIKEWWWRINDQPPVRDCHCWFDFEDGNTCMLPGQHGGSHERTSDSDIIIAFVSEEARDG